MSPAFLSFPNRNVGELYGVPSQGGEFNPAAIEFGDFLSCLTGPTLLQRAKFSFVVYFHENGRVEGEPMGEVDLDGSVDYMTFYNFVEKKLFDRKYEAEERRLMASAPRRAKSTGEGLVNHSTISKTTLDGKFTPGEFHGTRVSYVDLTPEPRRYDRALHRWRAKRAQEHVRGRHNPPPPRPAVRPVRPIYNCAWTPSHFVSPGSYSYMPKVYTHWKESSAYLDNEKIQRSAGKDVDALEPDLSKICITRKEVEGVLSKSKVSFKVVE